MGKILKLIFLVVILAIPAGIFTFLRYFGDNKFDVEIFFTQGIETPIGNCETTNEQYSVPKELLSDSKVNIVVAFNRGDLKILSNISARLKDTFGDKYDMIIFSQDSIHSDNTELLQVKIVDDLTKVMNCGFITDDVKSLVLVDKQNRIRGYYSDELDEIDRLIVELKIIIENDQRIGD